MWLDEFKQEVVGQETAVANKILNPEQPIDFTGAPRQNPGPSEFPDSAKDRQDFMELLYAKGITNSEAASLVTDFYMSMDPSRQMKCGNALMAEEFTGALDALVAQTEAWQDKALPPLTLLGTPAQDEEELPF